MSGSFEVKKPVQDMPRPGGYAPVSFARNVPKRGPSGLLTFAIGGTVMALGFVQVIRGNRMRRRLKAEKYHARMAVTPFLQAEEDRRFVRAVHAARELEAEAMADRPTWTVGESPYNTTAYQHAAV